jgi:Flp pilus assembly pilin Flp
MISDAINRAFIRAYVAVKREEGQTFVEYSLIGVLIAVALVVALGTFQGKIAGALTAIGGHLS